MNMSSNTSSYGNSLVLTNRKLASVLEVSAMVIYPILLLIFGILDYFLCIVDKDFFKNLTLRASPKQMYKDPMGFILLIFSWIFLILLPLFILDFIIAFILGLKNADTENGASRWKCFLSYLFIGSVYKDHRKTL